MLGMPEEADSFVLPDLEDPKECHEIIHAQSLHSHLDQNLSVTPDFALNDKVLSSNLHAQQSQRNKERFQESSNDHG